MSNGIQPLGSNAGFKVKADADAVIVNDEGEVLQQGRQLADQQSGAGFPNDSSVGTLPVPVSVFGPDHHQTFWHLKEVYKLDPGLALSMSKLDDEIETQSLGDRTQGYFEQTEFDTVSTPEQKEAAKRLLDVIAYSRDDHSFDPCWFDQLAERHPKMAATLSELDRPFSIKKGHSDSYKVDRLSPAMQQRYIRVDQILRSEKDRQVLDKQAWDATSELRVMEQAVGNKAGLVAWLTGMGTGVVGAATAAIVGAGGPLIWTFAGIAAVSGGLPFLLEPLNIEHDATHFFGRTFGRLFGSKRRRELKAERKRLTAEARSRARRIEALKALPPAKRLGAGNPNLGPM